jgi:hypothetical protein
MTNVAGVSCVGGIAVGSGEIEMANDSKKRRVRTKLKRSLTRHVKGGVDPNQESLASQEQAKKEQLDASNAKKYQGSVVMPG